jgi:two-component system LytT family response regulator
VSAAGPPPPDPAGAALRVLVVDDEAPARALAVEYLAAEPGVEVAGECANGFEAVRAVAELDPDVVLLDVQMPKLDGFEVVELLAERPGGPSGRPAVVFATAYDEYAIRAFEVRAVDYLLKPYPAERLGESLARARERLAAAGAGGPGGSGADPAVAAGLAAAARGGRPLERVLVRDGGRIHVVAAERLDYVEARGDTVRLVSGGAAHTKQQTLGELEAALDPARFVRIHRSFLLNVERLARIELYAKDSRVAILGDGTRLPVSRAGYARLRELL